MTQQYIGLITSAFGRHYQLETHSGKRLLAHPRGKKNEVVVGDCVLWQASQDEAVIEKIQPRRNLLYRQDNVRTKAFAANLDQVFLMIAAVPTFSERQLSRALIAAAQQNIAIKIILNKADLQPAFSQAQKKLNTYSYMGYDVIATSLKEPQAAIDRLRPLLEKKTTLLLGASGVGKSTLINTLIPDADAQTGELSTALKSGKHTTTTSQWYWVDHENRHSAIIDSPGFQEFGLHHIAPENLAELMPDFKAHLGHCRFYNCSHIHEPGCGIIDAVNEGKISAKRYSIYQEIIHEISKAPKF